MPGVPSGRGCDACRRQKKKCDLARPICSRCARLRIPCVGAGQQRYKFHNQTLTTNGGRAGSWSAAAVPVSEAQAAVVPLSPPSSRMTMTTSQLVSALEVLDPRFDLSVYGGFVRDIPRRLGSNEALDAAVGALTTALPLVQSRQQSAQAYGKYAQALQALRVCLGDPDKVASSNTMCALYLIVICHGWMGSLDDHQPSHGEAIAHMLSTVQWRAWDSGFEKDMLTTLCVLVILESFINPRIQLDPQLWGLPETFGPRSPADEQSHVESLKNRSLARITTLIRDPDTHLLEIETTYERVRADCAKMEAILAVIPVMPSADGRLTTPLPVSSRRLHVRWQTGYGILLLAAIILNKLLRAYQTPSGDSALREEAASLVDSVVTLAEQASQYRPLGSSATPVFLLAAYAALEDGEDEKMDRIGAMLAEYQSDFSLTRSASWAQYMHTHLQRPGPKSSLNTPEECRAGDVEYMYAEGRYFANKPGLCCIL